jgi:hypothetical protein
LCLLLVIWNLIFGICCLKFVRIFHPSERPPHMKYSLFFLCFFLYLAGIAQEDMSVLYKDSPSIEGTEAYLPSPYVTAGNRVYMVGHQDGSFPDLGWHIPGEMGGIWNHPIKLMDGFEATIKTGQEVFALDEASQFINYPTANKHIFEVTEDLEVERWQFVPDDIQGILIQYNLTNSSTEALELDFNFLGQVDLRPTWLGEETNMINARDTIWFHKEQNAVIAKDVKNPWFALYGSHLNMEEIPKQTSSSEAGELRYSLQIPAGEKKIINFFITGSYKSAEEAIKTYELLKQNYPGFIKEKQERYRELEKKSRLRIPDQRMQQTFEWLKYNSDWLIRTVPEIGSGIGAGITRLSLVVRGGQRICPAGLYGSGTNRPGIQYHSPFG